jgi:predicted RNA binding protein YcfA (HicA-like mRNA interferase family)
MQSTFREGVCDVDTSKCVAEGGFHTVLLCRVLGGRVRYCAERSPDAEALTKDCVEGPFDCILGDRRKVSGTYREFVVFDSENVYPEYILKYTRGPLFKSSSYPEYLLKPAESAPAVPPSLSEKDAIAYLVAMGFTQQKAKAAQHLLHHADEKVKVVLVETLEKLALKPKRLDACGNGGFSEESVLAPLRVMMQLPEPKPQTAAKSIMEALAAFSDDA